MTQSIGVSKAHSHLTADGITSFYIGCISYSIHFGHLCFRALLSEDVKKGEDASADAKWKFPGGMSAAHEVEADTMYREWHQETMRPNTGVQLDPDRATLVLSKDSRDEKHPGGKHRKMFYLFDERKLQNYKGDIHFRALPKNELSDDENPGGLLYVAQPIRVPTLSYQMKLTRSFSHREALVMAVRHIAATDRVLCDAIPTDFLNWASSDAFKNRD